MPSLHDAFSPASSALAGPVDPDDSDFDGLAPFEAMVAVVLDRNLHRINWRVVLAILRDVDCLTPEQMLDADPVEIGDELPREKSAFAVKLLPTLKKLAAWVLEKKDAGVWPEDRRGTLARHQSVDSLRQELAGIQGIGLATADAILVFGLGLPAFPVDRASFRILVRHGWLDSSASYDDAREILVHAAISRADRLRRDHVGVLIDVSNRLTGIGRTFCRAGAPRCEGCPFQPYLPEGGPCDDHG